MQLPPAPYQRDWALVGVCIFCCVQASIIPLTAKEPISLYACMQAAADLPQPAGCLSENSSIHERLEEACCILTTDTTDQLSRSRLWTGPFGWSSAANAISSDDVLCCALRQARGLVYSGLPVAVLEAQQNSGRGCMCPAVPCTGMVLAWQLCVHILMLMGSDMKL